MMRGATTGHGTAGGAIADQEITGGAVADQGMAGRVVAGQLITRGAGQGMADRTRSRYYEGYYKSLRNRKR